MARLYFSFCFVLVCTLLTAQTSLGLKVQGGAAWQKYEARGFFPVPEDSYEQRITHQGISLEIFRQLQHPRFELGIAPGYLRRGSACEPGFTGGFFNVEDATLYANYVQAPVLLRYRPVLKDRLSVVTQLGGGLGYLYSAYRDVSFWAPEQPDEKQEVIFENEPNLNRWDIGLQGGLGLAYRFGPGELQLTGDYYHSLVDLNQNFGSQHRAWSVGLGYAFKW